MQGQTARTEERGYETKKTGQRREIFCGIPARGPEKAEAPALRVGDLDSHPALSHGGLPARAFQARSIKPPEADGHQPGQSARIPLHQRPLLHARLAIEMSPCARNLDGHVAEDKEDRDGYE